MEAGRREAGGLCRQETHFAWVIEQAAPCAGVLLGVTEPRALCAVCPVYTHHQHL